MMTSFILAADGVYTGKNAKQEKTEGYNAFSNSQEIKSSYRELKMVKAMSESSETPSFIKIDFKSIVLALLSILVALVGIIWYNLTDDIKEIQTDQKNIQKEIVETRIQLVSSLAAVERQLAITNQKLEDSVLNLKKKSNN